MLRGWRFGVLTRRGAPRIADPQFVPPEQRIATFDNDGTLWSEQPIYFQFAFALARVKALAPKHPEWTDAAREWAYDRQSHVGRLDKALDEAKRRGWTVVDMKTDWKQIFAFE